jgi:hypothetical protein
MPKDMNLARRIKRDPVITLPMWRPYQWVDNSYS